MASRVVVGGGVNGLSVAGRPAERGWIARVWSMLGLSSAGYGEFFTSELAFAQRATHAASMGPYPWT
jgi:hypothetical protein